MSGVSAPRRARLDRCNRPIRLLGPPARRTSATSFAHPHVDRYFALGDPGLHAFDVPACDFANAQGANRGRRVTCQARIVCSPRPFTLVWPGSRPVAQPSLNQVIDRDRLANFTLCRVSIIPRCDKSRTLARLEQLIRRLQVGPGRRSCAGCALRQAKRRDATPP